MIIKNVLNSDPKRKYGWDEKTNSWIVNATNVNVPMLQKLLKVCH